MDGVGGRRRKRWGATLQLNTVSEFNYGVREGGREGELLQLGNLVSAANERSYIGA